MRITSDMSYRMLSQALAKHQAGIQKYHQQISSGKEVEKGSDDPGAFGMIGALKSDLTRLEQYKRNADMALSYHKAVDQSLTQAVNMLHRINELAVKGGDATLDETSRAALAEEVDALLESMLAQANGTDGSRYVFAGLRSDAAPYEATRDAATGKILSVQYVGSQETRQIKTGDSQYVSTNFPGSTATSEQGIFQTGTRDIFNSIVELRQRLESGQSVADSDCMENLQGDLDHLLANVSLNGVRQEQVTLQRTYLLQQQLANQEATEKFESVDLASATIKLSAEETAYQAALSSTSRMLQQVNLLDYL